MDLLEKIIGTIILRWYVTLFLLGYLFVAVVHLGWKRMSVFSVIGVIVGFLADYSSTHNGFPFGLYHYTQLTKGQELFIDNVPAITALSFIFLSYIGYNMAIFFCSPLIIKKNDVQVIPTKEIEYSLKVAIVGALIMTLIDVVIDPITLQGEKWFLGNFYWYQEKGEHFGVPLTNYCGWFIVGFLTILLFQYSDKYLSKKPTGLMKGQCHIPFFGIAGILFYFSIFIFMLTIAYSIQETQIIISSLITFTPLTFLIIISFFKKTKRATANDLLYHQRDYPHSPLLTCWKNRKP